MNTSDQELVRIFKTYLTDMTPDQRRSVLQNVANYAADAAKDQEEQDRQERLGNYDSWSREEVGDQIRKLANDPNKNKAKLKELSAVLDRKVQQEAARIAEANRPSESELQEREVKVQQINSELEMVEKQIANLSTSPSGNWSQLKELQAKQTQLINMRRGLS